MAKSLKKETISSIKWTSLGSTINFVSKLIVMFVLARLLTPSEFGIVGIGLLMTDFGRKFMDMGLGAAVIQRKEITQAHINTMFTTNLIIGVVMCVINIVFAKPIALFFDSPESTLVIQVLAVTYIIRSFYSSAFSMFRRNMKFKELAMIETSSYFFGYGFVGIILAWWGLGIWALVGAVLGQSLLQGIQALIKNTNHVKLHFDKEAFSNLFSYGLGQTLYQFISFFALQGDNFVVGRMLGPAALGLYGRAYQLISVPTKLYTQGVGNVLFTAFSKIQDEPEKLQKVFISGLQTAATLILPAGIFISFSAASIIEIFLGEKWLEATFPVQVFANIIFFRIFYDVSGSILRSTGLIYEKTYLEIIYAGLVLGLSYIGSLYYGIDGVAIGVGLSVIIHSILSIGYIIYSIGFSIVRILKSLLFPVILTLVVIVALYSTFLLQNLYNISHIWGILLSNFLVFSIVVGIAIFLFPEQLVGELLGSRLFPLLNKWKKKLF